MKTIKLLITEHNELQFLVTNGRESDISTLNVSFNFNDVTSPVYSCTLTRHIDYSGGCFGYFTYLSDVITSDCKTIIDDWITKDEQYPSLVSFNGLELNSEKLGGTVNPQKLISVFFDSVFSTFLLEEADQKIFQNYCEQQGLDYLIPKNQLSPLINQSFLTTSRKKTEEISDDIFKTINFN